MSDLIFPKCELEYHHGKLLFVCLQEKCSKFFQPMCSDCIEKNVHNHEQDSSDNNFHLIMDVLKRLQKQSKISNFKEQNDQTSENWLKLAQELKAQGELCIKTSEQIEQIVANKENDENEEDGETFENSLDYFRYSDEIQSTKLSQKLKNLREFIYLDEVKFDYSDELLQKNLVNLIRLGGKQNILEKNMEQMKEKLKNISEVVRKSSAFMQFSEKLKISGMILSENNTTVTNDASEDGFQYILSDFNLNKDKQTYFGFKANKAGQVGIGICGKKPEKDHRYSESDFEKASILALSDGTVFYEKKEEKNGEFTFQDGDQILCCFDPIGKTFKMYNSTNQLKYQFENVEFPQDLDVRICCILIDQGDSLTFLNKQQLESIKNQYEPSTEKHILTME